MIGVGKQRGLGEQLAQLRGVSIRAMPPTGMSFAATISSTLPHPLIVRRYRFQYVYTAWTDSVLRGYIGNMGVGSRN